MYIISKEKRHTQFNLIFHKQITFTFSFQEKSTEQQYFIFSTPRVRLS